MSVKTVLLLGAALMSFGTMAGDIAAGKSKSTSCAACHGVKGVSMIPMYPNLAGQKEQYLKKQLKDLRDGVRKDPVMSAMAKPLSDTDIEDLAAYFSSLDPKG
ncbi:c-type cytochrome [Neptunicella sp.]|uniref:c-type cytochrome n=1 Tax=Neptunicella sp. TaxID=2125986 RepID=UPI003F68E364